jgi:hypothetical protein
MGYDDLPDAQGGYDDLPDAAPAQPAISGGEAALRGFANSASLGLGKWANALASETGIPQAAAELIGGSTEPGKNRLESAWDQLNPNAHSGKSFWGDITASVEGEKAMNAAAFNQHPGYYMAGALAPAAVSAGAALKGAVTLPATLTSQVGVGAGVGAVSGASEGTNLKSAAAGATVGAGLGVGGTLLANGLATGGQALLASKGSQYLINTVQGLVKTARGEGAEADAAMAQLKTVFKKGTSLDDIESTLKQANDIGDTANEVGQSLQRVQPGSDMAAVQKVAGLAPSFGQIAKEGGQAALYGGAAGTAAEYAASHFGVPPGVAAAIGGTLGAKGPLKQMGNDLLNKAAVGYVSSPNFIASTNAAKASAPFAIGNGAGGLGGGLGDYINNFWLK